MKKTRQRISLIGALCCFAPLQLMKAADGCPELQGKDSAARLEYLRGDRLKLSSKCIVGAIKYLGVKRYPQASAMLIQYLDYRDPSPMPSWSPTPAAFPAVDALDSLGKSVVPELVAAISDPNTVELIRQHAGEVIFLIYGAYNSDGISALVNAAHAESDPMAAIHLMDQARRLARRCPVAARNDCENAVLK